MDNFIKNLEIKNFKSIKHLSLDCKRVNVFIGKPNVGKSNILEALGLFSSEFMMENLNEFIRMKKLDDLFFDFFLSDKISIKLDNKFHLTFSLENEKNGLAVFLLNIYENNTIIESIPLVRDGLIKWSESHYTKNVFTKYYRFNAFDPTDTHLKTYLYPPFGENLFEIVTNYPEIRSRIVSMLKEQNLEFVSLINERDFKLQKNIDGFVTQYPYSSIPDTFQRFIFYLAAIESNTHSVLIFEEPEVHSFPPYVKELAERMILKDDNQYFVSTHSPYLLQTFIDSLDDTQLNVYLTYYKDYQTHVKALTPDDLSDIQRFGYDVFFNLKKFEPND
ncbi:AAA family ATPase [Runella slithyformis]|uniref:ATPase n=1 Tax=Runella slithyformis (strain ATCC 29530 / DSM 19594 / LMG 11500 / NCIMB 11436 / LSU 4) TaxID=761193 RepID=A0A7U3ZGC0_RUNSL|nr:AAA family ATPase [Runella slithyformis]AEI46695.1 ATPase [Runella slithyformis DSM 19594]